MYSVEEFDDCQVAMLNRCAMNAYLRFQTQIRSHRSGERLGIFYAANHIQVTRELAWTTRQRLEDTLCWFNVHLRVPHVRARHRRSVFWFKSSAKSFISRIWDLAWILEEEGLHVAREWTTNPGMIVYEDDYQIAAVPQGTKA